MRNIFNSEIREILGETSIKYDDGMSFLLSLYYGINPTYMPDNLKLRMLNLGIFEISDKEGVIWKVPLFEEQVKGFEWVVEYRDAFKRLNPDRAGDLNSCITRFKRFLAKYPEYRVEDIKDAVNAYFRSVTNSKYLMKSHKFIFEGHINTGSSELLTWLERIKENSSDGRSSSSNTMQ